MRSLERIKASEIQKIVHARQTTLHFDEEVRAFDLLRKLAQRRKHETLFFLQWDPETTFLGLTPEKLYARKGREIFSHAVAGTRPHGFGDELLTSEKERKEFEHVKEFLAAKLQEICTHVACSKTDLIQTGNLEHLTCNFSGTLYDSVSDEQIISSLHPTPAVCGLPQAQARQILVREEAFDRGWYSGCLGWTTPEEAEMAVAIRSALVVQKEMHLFAGAGIVKESHPLREWDELEQKIAAWIQEL